MRPLTNRQILRLTLLVTVLSTGLAYLVSGADWYSTLFTVPLVASASFWSFRISQRIAAHFAPPPPAPRGPAVVEPSTDRPEHVHRRRQRRRPRGGRRPVE